MIKATISSPEQYKALQQDIVNHPRYDLSQRAGLELPTVRPNTEEEDFMGHTLAEKIPVLGKVTRQSHQGFTAALNGMRMDAFSKYADMLEAKGKDFDKDPKPFHDAARWVNMTTGRGRLPGIGERAESVQRNRERTVFRPKTRSLPVGDLKILRHIKTWTR